MVLCRDDQTLKPGIFDHLHIAVCIKFKVIRHIPEYLIYIISVMLAPFNFIECIRAEMHKSCQPVSLISQLAF